MDRRRFLQLLPAGAAACLARRAQADAPYDGPLLLAVHADGGWDTSLLTDPKGDDGSASPINRFAASEILEIGPFRLAPIEGHADFFERFGDELLVLHGVDAQTNNHDAGVRHAWSGSLGIGGPHLGAVLASAADPPPPLALLGHGAYDEVAGLVPLARLDDPTMLRDLSAPEWLEPGDAEVGPWTAAVVERLERARAERLARIRAAETLPRGRALWDQLGAVRGRASELSAVADLLPPLDGSNNPLLRQAQVTMACFRAGTTAAATLRLGGFDTHANNDAAQTTLLQRLLAGVAFALDEAERQGVRDRLTVVIGSDFGRGPRYNDAGGKDHSPTTALMVLGPGIRGGRVVGATDAGGLPRAIDPSTLTLDPDGVVLTPGHLHAALRAHLGVEGTEAALRYAVGEALPLLG